MIKPRRLSEGSVIRVVSPASPVEVTKLQSGITLLEQKGFQVQLGTHVLDSHFYLAGTDADRAQDLNEAFADPTVAAILCARGGYGCARLLPHLDLDQMAKSGKLFVGFSDVTTLHLALNRRGLATVYAPMLLTFNKERPDWVLESWLNAFEGKPTIPEKAPNGETVTGGVASEVVTGGCLCLLTDSLATPDSLDCEGKILLIEDVDEAPHRIDAMLTHLRLSGQLQRAAGIVVGEMTRTDEKEDVEIGAMPWQDIIKDRIGDLGIPAVINYPFGHAAAMLSLPLGIRARLDASEGSLTYLESLCD